jgi:hypothetical protein
MKVIKSRCAVKISELIKKLQQIKKEHGDLDVINRTKPNKEFHDPAISYRIKSGLYERHCGRPREGARLVVRVGY